MSGPLSFPRRMSSTRDPVVSGLGSLRQGYRSLPPVYCPVGPYVSRRFFCDRERVP